MSQRRRESCYFVDLCLLLPQTKRPEIDVELLHSILHGEDCYVSSSVKERFDETLNSAYDYILRDLRDNLPEYLRTKGCNQLRDYDALLMESFFHKRRNDLRRKRSSAIYFMIEGHIESWIVQQIHSLRRGIGVSVENFLVAILRELSNRYEELRSPVEALSVKDIKPKPRLKAESLLQGIRKDEDEDHIASAMEFQYVEDRWTIFLTHDELHILNSAPNLRNNCALYVSKPIYATDHHRELSKEKAPIDFFRDRLENPTPQQRRFAKALREALGIAILET